MKQTCLFPLAEESDSSRDKKQEAPTPTLPKARAALMGLSIVAAHINSQNPSCCSVVVQWVSSLILCFSTSAPGA